MRTDPQTWASHDATWDGTRIFIRPLRPDDAALYPDLFSAISAADMRLRFFAPIREPSERFVAQLVNIDFDSAIALVGIDEATGQILGVVRLHLDPDRRSGEYAVIVRSRLKGRGLGWLLMKKIIACAKAEGLETIHGQVLSENVTMLAMCAELGFHVADDPETPGVKVVTLRLDDVPAADPAPCVSME